MRHLGRQRGIPCRCQRQHAGEGGAFVFHQRRLQADALRRVGHRDGAHSQTGYAGYHEAVPAARQPQLLLEVHAADQICGTLGSRERRVGVDGAAHDGVGFGKRFERRDVNGHHAGGIGAFALLPVRCGVARKAVQEE